MTKQINNKEQIKTWGTPNASRWYQLQDFGQVNDKTSTDIALFAAVDKVDSGLLLQYRLKDLQKQVLKSSFQPNAVMQRSHELWKTTCFEAFWAAVAEEKYWELNLSANKQYNIYSFQSYRTPQPPKEDLQFSVVKMQQEKNTLRAWIEGPFPAKPLVFNLCAVLKLQVLPEREAETLFMSNQHTGIKPDFHLRQGFNIVVS